MEKDINDNEREKSGLIAILDRDSEYVDMATTAPLNLGQIAYGYPNEYKQLLEILKKAEPVGEGIFGPERAKVIGFTRQIDKLYNEGERKISTYWATLTKMFKTDGEAYNFLVKSAEFPELTERYKRS